MLYALLKSIHLLAFVVWVGGMFFTLFCLRPALAVLEGPARLKLMSEVLGRFFAVVGIAIGLMALTGVAMLFMAMHPASDAGVQVRIPLAWNLMIGLGIVMMAIYGHLRANLFRKLQRAVQAQDAPAGAAVLAKIRRWVGVNLAIGVVVALVMRVGLAM
jgi:uncharacterized membrane protein